MADKRAPKLIELKLPKIVDLTLGNNAFKLTYAAKDDLSGVSSIWVVFDRNFTASSSQGGIFYDEDYLNRDGFYPDIYDARRSVSGTDELWVSDWNSAGIYRISWVYLTDAQGNTTILDSADLRQLGFRTSVRFVDAAYPHGTRHDDRLVGNDKVNFMWGEGGDDFLSGAAGNDELDGGKGDDLLRGGNGKDYLEGGTDNDRLFGDPGNDFLDGGAGNDQLSGGEATIGWPRRVAAQTYS